MAEREGFRIAFRGFHRQDVMTYVNTLQADFSRREAGLRDGLTEANACLASLTADNEQLKATAAAAEEKAEHIRAEAFDRFEQMNAELIMLKKENERLRGQSAYDTADTIDNAATVGDLLAAIDEIRTRGTDFLAASGEAGEHCLDEMDELVASLEESLAQMREKIGAARSDLNGRRNAAGLRLSELEAQLKSDAKSVSASVPKKPFTPKAASAAKSAKKPEESAASARLVPQPEKPRDGWRRFLNGLLG